NMSRRLGVMGKLHINREIISLALPDIDDLHLDGGKALEVMRSANDGIYETANNSGDRFLPIGTVSLYDTNAAIAKATRCIKDL
ncbi:metal dependent hydrolase, partial [mine drainage metagenome]